MPVRSYLDGYIKAMAKENRPEIERQSHPEWLAADYAEWLSTKLEEGQAELDAGKGISATEVWKALRLK